MTITHPAEQARQPDHLTLKWGGLKSWNVNSEKGQALLRYIFNQGVSSSAISQKNTDGQKQAICDLIDEIECDEIWSDWDGTKMTKDEAKKYVMEYGK